MRLRGLAWRRDGDEWIVGRMDVGAFVALPEVGKRVVELLEDGMSAGEARAVLLGETGQDVDVAGFVEDLIALDFVAEAGGRDLASAAAPRATFPRLRPEHVRFALSPVAVWAAVALPVAAAVTLVLRPGLVPGYRDLLWSPHGSLVLGFTAAAGWTILMAHELAHLVVARATGVPARIRLGTRLQFLVMETDISGIELAPRRHRLTAYLAGIAVNVAVASAAVLLGAATAPGTLPHRLLGAVALLALLPLPFQFMVFMRTDVYFVLQDLTRCRDLYGEGAAFARYAARRLRHTARRRGPPPADPSARLPPGERRAVRAYSAVQVLGTAACLAALAVVTLPADVTLLVRAASALGPDRPPIANLDAAAVLVTLTALHVLWAVTWWRGRVRRRRATP
ncbi:hypothetical protein [Sphaerisporangium aureirubrum]|uniref:PqqD family protein n=1 Tax=Sphaerisporangium aureirubrum TaxID=1544736 RepID=A0ABW1NP12_9ACTN